MVCLSVTAGAIISCRSGGTSATFLVAHTTSVGQSEGMVFARNGDPNVQSKGARPSLATSGTEGRTSPAISHYRSYHYQSPPTMTRPPSLETAVITRMDRVALVFDSLIIRPEDERDFGQLSALKIQRANCAYPAPSHEEHAFLVLSRHRVGSALSRAVAGIGHDIPLSRSSEGMLCLSRAL